MHEMSLAEGVLQLVTDTARREAATRVKTVVLEIGKLSAVEPEALKFCFDIVTHGSIAQGAVLEIITVPGAGRCMLCGETVAMEARYDACPKCGSYQVQTTGGSEMRVKEIEIE